MRGGIGLRLLWALLFGAITAGLVYVYLQRLPLEAGGSQVPVVVAVRDIEAGTVVRADMMKVARWPESAILPGALQNPEDALGRRTAVALVPDQPLLSNQLKPLEAVEHGGQVPLGMRLVTVPIDEQATIGYRLRARDKVDIISVYRDSTGLHSEMAVQGIEVYAVGAERTDGKSAEPRTATLLVTPQQGLQISLLAEEKSLRLLLRPAGDPDEVEVTTVHRLK